jgi:3-hydroxyisobutyrate dehydrogenase-like beta-hydroxyacid dehydrogenase
MNELGQKVEEESDLSLISVAVSGGAAGAQAGTLSIMTSGSENIVKSFRPYFDAMGKIYSSMATNRQQPGSKTSQ